MNVPSRRSHVARLQSVTVRCALICLLPSLALAQRDTDTRTLADCARIEGASKRLACYDRFSAPPQSEAPSEPTGRTDSSRDEPTATARAATQQAATQGAADGAADDDTESRRTAGDDSAPAAAPARRRAARRVSDAGSDSGSDSRSASNRASGRTDYSDRWAESSVVIVNVQRTVVGDTYFRTESGELYKQTSRARSRFPDVPYTAGLQRASRGSYFLSSPLGGPRVRVSLQD